MGEMEWIDLALESGNVVTGRKDYANEKCQMSHSEI